MSTDTPIPLPPATPRTRGRFTRWVGRCGLRLGGWRIHGSLPDCSKLVCIVAPHSSNWDFVWGLLAKWALGLRVVFLAKRALFQWPFGWFMRGIGGIAVDRHAPDGLVDSVAARFQQPDPLWLFIAPEGTRSAVTRWKTGFWRIARSANVPILCVYFHYPEKTIGLGPLFQPSDDLEHDLSRLRAVYAPWQGKRR